MTAAQTYRCETCQADLGAEDLVVAASGGRAVHLADTGPGHRDLQEHPVRGGRPFGRRYRTAQPAAGRPARGGVLSPPPGLASATPPGWAFWTDASQWQGRPYDASYPWPFAMYRLTLSTTLTDALAAANTAYCHANAGPGRQLSAGHGGYHVWYPGGEAEQARRFLAAAAVDEFFVAMVDVESWSGAIRGDHSAQITQLVTLLAQRLGRARVLVYGNDADLAGIYPTRPAWLKVIRAKYSAQPPSVDAFGWQYTDGSTNWPAPAGWPRSSAPFGACDHNAFRGSAADLASQLGLTEGTLMLDSTDHTYIDGKFADLKAAVGTAAEAAATLVKQDLAGTKVRVAAIPSTLTALAASVQQVDADVAALPAAVAKAVAAAVAAGGAGADPATLAAAIAPHLQVGAAAATASATAARAGARTAHADLQAALTALQQAEDKAAALDAEAERAEAERATQAEPQR